MNILSGQRGSNTENNTDYLQQLRVTASALTINKGRCVCMCRVEGEVGEVFLFFLSASPPITIHYYKLGFNKIAIQR